MSDTCDLRYRGFHAELEALQVGECTVRPCEEKHRDYWRLWFRVISAVDGQPFVASIPINPGGYYVSDGPGGKTWGMRLSDTIADVWQILPSINVLAHGEVHPGEHPAPSLWHQTPAIVGVPGGERWQAGPPGPREPGEPREAA